MDRELVVRTLASAGPFVLLRTLGVPHKREGRAARLRCLFHDEKTPSATFAIGGEGTLRFHCFGCDRTASALDLIAEVRGLDARRDFRRVLEEAGELAGVSGDVGAPRIYAPRPVPQSPAPTYPPREQVSQLWAACVAVDTDDEVSAYLARKRGLDPLAVASYDLARALPRGARCPDWATYGGASWAAGGRRLLVPTFDASGAMRSLRAWDLTGRSDAKRTTPKGYSTASVVLADLGGVAMLAGRVAPARVVVAEGEPDFLTWAARASDADEDAPAVLGVFSGAWSEEVARRIPGGVRVDVRTHDDERGHKYAREIGASLADRCDVRVRRRAA